MPRPTFEEAHGEKPVAINIYLTAALYDKVIRESNGSGLSRSAVIRTILAHHYTKIERLGKSL